MRVNVLLVEDDPRLGKTIQSELERNEFAVYHAFDGDIAKRLFSQEKIDIVLLDINVPHVNGFELCRIFRSLNPGVPIIMLTALGELDDKMNAFSAGADDYMVKPFNIKELIARMKVFIKRRSSGESYQEILEAGDLVINMMEKQVTRAGVPVNLTAKEFKLLEVLVRNKGKVFSKTELAEKVWGLNYDTGTNTIEVYINFLRNKIDKPFGEKLIYTKTGFGYYIKQS
jgi:two-component system copper resistance phosphate regulon response regulator CusR